MENEPEKKRNVWNLVLGIIFLVYGVYRVYALSGNIQENSLGFILAIGFIAFGIYDLYKYYYAL